MRLLMLCLGLAFAALLVGSVWLDEAEVVTITTWDPTHHPHESRLWIVDVDGERYLRADLPHASWLERLRAHPEIELRRDGSREHLLAVPVVDAAVRAQVNRAMAAKYGALDTLLGAVRDEDRALPVRLDATGTSED